MILHDTALQAGIESGIIGVEPFDPSMLQPASLDVRLGRDLLFQKDTEYEGPLPCTDPKTDSTGDWLPRGMNDYGGYIYPEDFVLGTTYERITLNGAVAARFEGKSSLGRIGLMTHVTAGFIDPGFSGHITVELKNVSRKPITLYPGMKIGQVCFYQMTAAPAIPYGNPGRGSHYQNQSGPQPSRIHENFHQTEI